MDKVTADWITEFNAMIAELDGPERDEEINLASGLVKRTAPDLSGGLVRRRHPNEMIERIPTRHEKLTSK